MIVVPMVVQVPAPAPPPDIPPEVLVWMQTVPPQVVMIVVLVVLAIGGTLLFTLIRAIARRIEGGAGIRDLRAEVEMLRHRVAEMEDGPLRLAELEERLDFAERLLAQGHQAEPRGPERAP